MTDFVLIIVAVLIATVVFLVVILFLKNTKIDSLENDLDAANIRLSYMENNLQGVQTSNIMLRKHIELLEEGYREKQIKIPKITFQGPE